MYNEYFGFSESPFKVAPDPRFFFVNPCYEEAFATLRYGIDTRKGFIVVTGEAGTGKTTLLKRLVHSVEPHVHTACIFDPHLSFVELLRNTLSDLGMTSVGADRLAMMEQFYLYLVRQLESDQIVALMIDEAQNLSGELLEEIRLLSNLETDTQKLIQIVLVGQPELEERLDQAQLLGLKQRVALRCRLRRLDWHEVGSYIDARLKTARFERRDLFDAECIERIALYSKGIPRIVNVICDNALLNAYATSAKRVSLKEIDTAAYELKLRDEPPIANQMPVDGLSMTVGARENVYQSGAASRPAIATRDDWAPPEFERLFGEIGERPQGWKRSERSYARGVGFLLILYMTVGILFIFEAQQRQFSFPLASSFIEKLAVFVGERETARPTGAPEVQTQTTNDTGSKIEPALENPPASTEGSSEAVAPGSDPAETNRPSEIVQTVKKEPPAKGSTETSENKPPIVKR